jgi:hypothetical protein
MDSAPAPAASPRALVNAIAASFVVSGVLEAFAPQQHLRAIALVHGVIIGVLCYLWCKADAAAQGRVPPGRSALVAGVFPLVGIPVYLFRTRPARRAAVTTLKAVGLLFVLAVLGVAVVEIVNVLRA